MRCRFPQPLKVVCFMKNSLSFYQLNISRADIPFVLENGVVGAAVQSAQPVTLYMTVNIAPRNLYNVPPSIPIEDDDSSAEKATISGPIQSLAPEHHQPVETGNTMPQIPEEISPTNTRNPHFALRWADETMRQIVPTDRSNMWESTVGRIKWVMDTLGPIAEVRVMPFSWPWLELTSILSFPHSQRWRTVYFQQSPRHVYSCHFRTRCSCYVRLDCRHS